MTVDKQQDAGVIEALLQRLNDFRLPRMLDLKKVVDRGDPISQTDMDFLERVLEDAQTAQGLFDRHPELQPLAARLSSLYQDIVSKALENEKKIRPIK